MKKFLIFIGVLAAFEATLAKQVVLHDEEYLQAVRNEQRVFEGMINSTINKIIDSISTFDPINIDSKEINFIGHEGNLNDVHVKGFGNIAATHISLGGFITWSLELEIEAPLITANIDHWNVIGDIFFGDGAVSVLLEKMKLRVDATINPITQYVKTLHIRPSIGNAAVSITGLYDDPKLSESISSLFNYVLNDFINNNTEFHDTISKLLLSIIQNK